MYMKMLSRLRGIMLTDLFYNFKSRSLTFGMSKVSYHYDYIPNCSKVWLHFCTMKYAENVFKQKLLNDLISECDLNYPNLTANNFGKQLLIKLDFMKLQNFGIVLSSNSIIDKLLSNLEPFPFDSTELEKISPNSISIGKIRNAIEKQYLSWKFKVHYQMVDSVFYRFRICCYAFRSFTNLKKGVLMLETVPRIQEMNVSEKIYLLNQKPFHDKNVLVSFQKNIAGIDWYMLPEYCYKILRHSHEYIISLISVLQNMKFSESQLQKGFPLLSLPFGTLFLRLNNMLKRPEIAKYRNEELFLLLLSFSPSTLSNLMHLNFSELIEIVMTSKKLQKIGTTRKDVMCIVSEMYEVDHSYFSVIPKNSLLKKLSEKQIYDTLCFLKEKHFTDKEVAESIPIIFYSRDVITKTLEKIKQDESKLRAIGFQDGCVTKETHNFAAGTTERRKILQLCLYYLEKSFQALGA